MRNSWLTGLETAMLLAGATLGLALFATGIL